MSDSTAAAAAEVERSFDALQAQAEQAQAIADAVRLTGRPLPIG